jgi:glycosyltransferase involved in cell wall biosynthesis
MKIGILGTRGIPNSYGGFEQFAQYLSQGLVRRGHSVWVYNSSDHPYKDKEWRGIHIIHCADWEARIGTAGQFIYDYNCLKDARKRNFDVLLQLGYTSNSIWHRIWPKQTLNVVNMDGLEWKRSKYSAVTRKFLQRAEAWAARHGDILIADSIGIRDYLLEKYQREAIYIPYGAEIPDRYDPQVLAKWDLQADKYMLLMARMEPENNVEMVIQGWMATGKERPLVLIGNPNNGFGRYLTGTYRHENLRFLGAIYDQAIVNALRYYSTLYFHGHSVGGTNPSLLEAMACESVIAAHNNPFNSAILGKDAFYFSNAGGIKEIIETEAATGMGLAWKAVNKEKVRELYNWEHIVEKYAALFNPKVSLFQDPLKQRGIGI